MLQARHHFIAEFINAQHGLGHYILKAGGTYDMARVFVGLGLMAGLSFLLNQLLDKNRLDNL